MNNLRDLHVLVLGLGVSGLAMVRWCALHGAVVTVVDTREAPAQLAVLRAELPAVTFVHSDFNAALVEGTSIRAVFKSPGLSPAETAAVMDVASALGLWVGGELTLFAQALKDLAETKVPAIHALYQPKVLAITGTNGKTTVTALTGHLVRWAEKSVAVAGNIGPTLLDTLSKALAEGALPEVWVLELSSFQLDVPSGLEPTAAVVLNLTQDHLDWHGNMAAYAKAKANIFGANGLMVLNREDAAVMSMRPAPVRAKLQRPVQREYVSFGTDMPQRPGDFGLEDVNGMTWLVRALEADETRKPRRRAAGPPQGAAAPSGGSAAHAVASVGACDDEELHIQRFMPAEALRIRGRHNASNALAALALCSAAGCALGPILFGLREYRGEPHRVESVGILNGVEFFDDSKGTNVGATVAALSGLGAQRRLILLLGGEGKGQDFSPLAAPVARYVRSVVLFGRDAPLIRAALVDTDVPLVQASDMADAVAQANRAAHAGDAVLLSPACASFDMFKDYAHRAECFVEAVRTLALDSGSDLERVP
jgi:UDP-N-acetylmuramoylalanine--D-glutamate ligase